MILTFWVFVTIVFILFRVMPGDPASMYIQTGMTEEQRQAIRQYLGLNRPLHVQYFDYLGQILTGDFGLSYRYNAPVADILTVRLANTLILMFAALILAYAIGITLGALLGWKRGSRFERVGIILVLTARSSPPFVVGIVLLLIFTFLLGWLPSGGILPAGEFEAGIHASNYLQWEFVRHMILPMITGAFVWLATPTLLTRNSMLEVLDENYIEMKKAIGVPEIDIIYKHATRNSILPIVTIAALSTGFAFGGSVVIETVFSWPGMGREMVSALLARDYPVAMGAFYIMGSMVIFMNFVADMSYLYLDPRVRYDEE